MLNLREYLKKYPSAHVMELDDLYRVCCYDGETFTISFFMKDGTPFDERFKPFSAYLAGPIFTYGDYLRNTEWARYLRYEFPMMDLYSPVENTDINGVEGKKKFADSKMIASADNARLDKTDILIACIDGDVLPAGTCAEIGKFHEKIARGDKKFIVGICTDNRQCALTHSEAKDNGGASELGEQQYSYQNLYVTGLIKEYGVLVSNIDDAIDAIEHWLTEREENG